VLLCVVKLPSGRLSLQLTALQMFNRAVCVEVCEGLIVGLPGRLQDGWIWDGICVCVWGGGRGYNKQETAIKLLIESVFNSWFPLPPFASFSKSEAAAETTLSLFLHYYISWS